MTSHVAIDQWEKIEKDNTSWILNSKWNGQKYALEKFCSQHTVYLEIPAEQKFVTSITFQPKVEIGKIFVQTILRN